MITADALALFGFTDFEAIHDPGSDTRLLLGWRDGTLLLAFRGTASRANAVTDLKVGAGASIAGCTPGLARPAES